MVRVLTSPSLSLSLLHNMSQKFNRIKYYFLSHTNISIYYKSFLHSVKWFQVLQCIPNNSIKQSFVCTQLNVQTVQPLTNQLNSFVCTQFKCRTVLFDPLIGPYQMLLLRVKMDLGPMVMKRYSIFPWSLAIRLFNIILMTLDVGVLPLCRDAIGVFYSPTRLDSVRRKPILLGWIDRKSLFVYS